MTESEIRHRYQRPCQVCGQGLYLDFDICKNCWWQQDSVATHADFRNSPCGPNKVSFVEAKKNYSQCGVSDRRFVGRRPVR